MSGTEQRETHCVFEYATFPGDLEPGPCTRCGPDTPQGQISDYIDRHGMATIAITMPANGPTNPSAGNDELRYVHTVGRSDRGQPELMITGFHSHHVASHLLREIVHHCDVEPGKITAYPWPDGSFATIRFEPIPENTADHLMRDAAHRYGAARFTGLHIQFLGMDCLDPNCPHYDCQDKG